MADAVLDPDEDLRDAERIDRQLGAMSYREWFFKGVDDTIAAIGDTQQRRIAEDYYRTEREVYGKHGEAILAKLQDFLEDRTPQRLKRWAPAAGVALEAGCGTGQYQLGFARRFRQVIVTDISYVSLVQARRIALDEGLTNVTFLASSIEHLPIADGSVEFVHCNGVIEHVADPERTIGEIGRVLSATGVALVLSPNKYTLYVEPHFRVAGFSLWPLPLRRALARRFRGKDSFAGLHLRSLRELRGYAKRHFGEHHVFMLPRRLQTTYRPGPTRALIFALLQAPVVGGLVDAVLNRLLLGVVPYHILVAFKRPTAPGVR